MGDFTVQTLKKEVTTYEKAQKYYGMLSVWNDLYLTQREVQLLAHTAIRGTISSSSSKQDFSTLYQSSPATVNNIISKLKGLGLLVKVEGKYKVNPKIDLDFHKNVALGFKMINPKESDD